MYFLKLLKLLNIAIIFLTIFRKYEAKNYDVRFKALYCYNIDTNFVYNVTCRIKAVRGKLGIVEKIYHYRNMSDVWYSGTLYFRNTNGRYAPYILNLHMNFCEFADKAKHGNPMEQRMINLIALHDPSVLDGCPLKGPYRMVNFDFNAYVPGVLPPIIPAGDYLYHDHLHSADNHTYVTAKHFVTVKSVGLMDLSILKVGK